MHPDAVLAFGCRAAGAVQCAADRYVPGQNCEREMLVPGTADLLKVTGERERRGCVGRCVLKHGRFIVIDIKRFRETIIPAKYTI